MHTFYLRIIGFWLVAALALANNPVWAAQKNAAVAPPPKAGSIVKWVDEKGVTHYGDTMPPERSGHAHSELDRQGHEIKRNKAEDQANKTAIEEPKVSAEQQRHDSALLAAYTTEQEFDLARDRNLETDQAAVEGLNQRMASAKARLATTQKTADGASKNKKPVPDHITQELKENQNEIAKIEAQIKERQQSMDATRQRFEKDKQRFIELKHNPNAPPPPATAPVAAATSEAAEGAAESAPAPKPVATTAPMAAPKAPAAKLAPTAPVPGKPAVTPVAPAAATPAQPAAPVATKPISPAEKPAATTPTPAAPATKSVKKIKRVVMP